MEIRQIRYFLAIQECGSFTRAAEQLYVTQPALSAAIRSLEEELGSKLLNRLPKRVTLTAAGLKFRHRAFAILAEVNAARNEITEVEKQANKLRLGLLSTLNTPRVHRLLQDFSSSNPDIDLQLQSGNPQALAQMLGQNKVDLLITNISAEEHSSTTQLLYKERYLLIVAPNHPLATRDYLHLADLHEQPFVLRKHCEVLSEAQRLFMMEQAQPHITCRTDQDEWALTMVRTAGAAAIMAESGNYHSLVAIPLIDFDLHRKVGCQWREHSKYSNVELFSRFAAEHQQASSP